MSIGYATDSVQTRSVEDSISHAHDAAYRAAHLTCLILDDLNGPSPEAANAALNGGVTGGLVNSADFLASRLESLCHDLERVRSRLVRNDPKSLAGMAQAQAAAQALAQVPVAPRGYGG